MDAKEFIKSAEAGVDIAEAEAKEMIECYIIQCEIQTRALRQDFETKKHRHFSGYFLETWKDVLTHSLQAQVKTLLIIEDGVTIPNFRESLKAAQAAAFKPKH